MNLIYLVLTRVVVATVVVGAVVVAVQDLLVFPLLTHRLFRAKDRDPSTVPKGVESFRFTTSDGVELEGWHLPARNEDAPRGIAVVFHGNAETVVNAYGHMQWMNSLGLASFAYDYRGYGFSNGWPSEKGLYRDIDALRDEIRNRYNLDSLPLVTIGNSLGSGLSAYFGTLESVNTQVFFAPYYSLRDVVADHPIYRYLTPFFRYHIPTYQYLKEGNPHCIVIAHGQADQVIQVSHSERLVESLKDREKVISLFPEELGHNDILQREVIEEVDLQIQQCLS